MTSYNEFKWYFGAPFDELSNHCENEITPHIKVPKIISFNFYYFIGENLPNVFIIDPFPQQKKSALNSNIVEQLYVSKSAKMLGWLSPNKSANTFLLVYLNLNESDFYDWEGW